ncbi:MAG TPA: hypothetical protein VGS10_23765 [Terracidiphilus sp.]|nr:hypothetical protein [Terracidiphilus sp.]
MKNITKWMLAAALAIGGLGLTATPAKAAQIGFYIGSGDGYVPPAPGPGYTWINGYYANGYWVPGYWAFAGGYNGYYGNRFYGDRDDYYRDRDWYRDRDHRDGDRGWYGRDDHHDRGREGWRSDRGHDR